MAALVREYKEGKSSRYEPLLAREKAQRSALKTLANQAFDGAFGPLMHFLVRDQKLTAEQRQELMKVLEKKAKKGRSK